MFEQLAPWNWFREEREQRPRTVDAVTRPMLSLQREVDRLFDDFFRGGPGMRTEGEAGLVPRRSFLPQLNISETDHSYRIEIELPGVDKNDIDISVSEGRLYIRGERRQEEVEEGRRYHRVERSYGSFRRVLSLPDDTDHESIDASFKDGVLTIDMKKTRISERAPRKISVKSSSENVVPMKES